MEVIKRSYESMYITDAQLAVYKEQGFLIVENCLTRDEQEAALDGFLPILPRPTTAISPTRELL